jgi:hypothetical protein
MTFQGGCKCGAVAFEADGEIEQAIECNCSICRPKGYLHWFVPETSFRLSRGEDALGSFRFSQEVLDHRFCTTCGVSPFIQGPGTVAVNVRCLPEVDLAALKVVAYDGKHLR